MNKLTLDSPDEAFVERARQLYQRDGEVEIDEGSEVSRGEENGAYVLAWVWVAIDDCEEDE